MRETQPAGCWIGGEYEEKLLGTSLEVQWLRVCTSTAEGVGSVPGQGIEILHATRCTKRKKKKKLLNTLIFWEQVVGSRETEAQNMD